MCLTVSSIPVGIIGGIEGFQSTSFMLISLIFMVTFFVSITISYFITRPLEKLTSNINEISKGKLDVSLSPSEIFEINNLTDSLNRVMASLKLAIHKVGVKKGEIFEDAVKIKEAVEKKQEDLLNSIRGWAWETDEKGIYTFCSSTISELLGYDPEEMVGRNIFDFIAPEDLKNTKSVFNDAGKKKTPIKDLVNWNIKKNGEKVCVITNSFPFFDDDGNLLGYRGVDNNITSEKEYEIKVNELETKMADLKVELTKLLEERQIGGTEKITPIGEWKKFDDWTEQEFDSVFMFDEQANIIDCNENMYKRLGYSKREMLSLNMADFDALETKEEIIVKINKAKKNGSLSFKTIHKKKDGSAILVYENFQYIKGKRVQSNSQRGLHIQ